MADFYEYSTPELVRLLGTRFKEYRMRCNLTQKEVAEQSGVGLTTIHKFENGTAGNVSLSTFILLLKVVGQIDALDEVLPELPESPYLVRKDEKKAQRIRHSKYPMNIGNYHLYADIDDVERKFVIGKKKEKFSYIKQTGVANISNGELTKMAEKYFKL